MLLARSLECARPSGLRYIQRRTMPIGKTSCKVNQCTEATDPSTRSGRDGVHVPAQSVPYCDSSSATSPR